ncbi:hypothetical protein CKAN_01552500 [Cinnamomum micranthum f. kanehirae]|uniref:Uncharacterized protein n=1 Tax=Cinnamomum micranthum f. kanehirae TaxID=337451 RepID=A0A3S3QKL1_9MAGN|nr:hypothetical protein CKAN_01552500 [Cinnamomum micranthum f. kanehirae]
MRDCLSVSNAASAYNLFFPQGSFNHDTRWGKNLRANKHTEEQLPLLHLGLLPFQSVSSGSPPSTYKSDTLTGIDFGTAKTAKFRPEKSSRKQAYMKTVDTASKRDLTLHSMTKYGRIANAENQEPVPPLKRKRQKYRSYGELPSPRKSGQL